jgi:hypothetical protein
MICFTINKLSNHFYHPMFSQEVQQLCACCLANILRITAPEAPFKPGQMISVFQLFAKVIRNHLIVSDNEEAAFSRACYVLSSLASTHATFALFEIETSHPGDDKHDARVREEAGKCLVSFIEAMFDSLRPSSAQNVYSEVITIIVFLLEEGNPLSTNFIEAIMKRLLMRESNPRAWEASVEILRKTSDRTYPLVSGLACSAIRRASAALEKEAKKSSSVSKQKKGDMDDEDNEEDDDEDEDDTMISEGAEGSGEISCSTTFCTQPESAYSLAVELATACPPSLEKVIPLLTSKLETTSRGHSILTLGRLFALPVSSSSSASSSKYAGGSNASSGDDRSLAQPLGSRFATAFALWLRRFKDADLKVRCSMCHLGGQVLRVHESLSNQVANELAIRVKNDSHAEVRLQAVKAVCDAAYEKLDHVPLQLLRETARRYKDRDVEIRREVITGLAQAYRLHIEKIWSREVEFSNANAWDSSRTNKDGAMLPPERGSLEAFEPTSSEMAIIQKIFWVPSLVMICYAHRESEVRQRVVQIIDTVLLPESLDEETRAQGLAAMFTTFNAEAKRQFFRMQRDRCKAQLDLSRLVHIRDELKKADAATALTLKAELSQVIQQLSSDRQQQSTTIDSLSSSSSSSSSSQRTALALSAMIEKVPDNRVFMRLETIAEPCTSIEMMKTAKDDLIQRVKMAVVNASNASAPAGGSGRSSIKGEKSSSSASNEADGMSFLVDSLKAVLRRAQMATVTVGMIPCLFNLLMQQIARDNIDDAKCTLQLFTGMATFFPSIFATNAAGGEAGPIGISPSECLLSLLHSNEPTLVIGALKTITLLGGSVIFPASTPGIATSADHAKNALLTLCTQGSIDVAKHAVYASISLFHVGDESEYSFSSSGKSLLPEDSPDKVRELALLALSAKNDRIGKGLHTATGKKSGSSSNNISSSSTLSAVVPETDDFFDKLIGRLSAPKPLSGSNSNLHSLLASIAALSLRAPWLYAKMDGTSLNPMPMPSTASKSSSTTAAASNPCPPPGRVTQWLLKFIISTPSEAEIAAFPVKKVNSASRRAAMAKKRAAALEEDEEEEEEEVLAKTNAEEGGEEEEGEEEEEEEEEDDDDDDEGFGKRSKKNNKRARGKGKRSAATKSKSTKSTASKKRARDEKVTSSASDHISAASSKRSTTGKSSEREADVVSETIEDVFSPPSTIEQKPTGWYKGFEPSGSTLSRILAMNVVAGISRGLSLRAMYLIKRAQLAESEKTSASSARASFFSSSSWFTGMMAISRGTLLTKAIELILKAGGDLSSEVVSSSHSESESQAPFLYMVKDSILGSSSSSSSSSSSVAAASSGRTTATITPTRGSAFGGDGNVTSIDASVLRIACFCISLRLAARPSDSTPLTGTSIDSQVVSLSLWKRLFYSSLQDSDIDVREAALTHLQKLLNRCLLPMRYVIFPMLSAVDPQKRVRKLGKKVLFDAVQVYSKNAASLATSSLGNPTVQKAILGLRVEYSLSFALYLLSNDLRRIPNESISNGSISAILKKAGEDALTLFDSTSPFSAHAHCLNLLLDAVLFASTVVSGADPVEGTSRGHATRAGAGSLSIMHTLYTALCDYDDPAQAGKGVEYARAFKNLNTLLFCLLKPKTKVQAGFEKFPGVIPVPNGMLTKRVVEKV